IMKDNPTQAAREIAVSKLEVDKNDEQWLLMSRDTFKELQKELIEMPLEEVNTLPDYLKSWILDAREALDKDKLPDTKISRLATIKTKDAIEHIGNLVQVAKRLESNLLPYSLYDWDITLLDAVVENEEGDSDIVQQLHQDYMTKCLFYHMKEELSQLGDIDSWEEIKIKDITYTLLGRLSMRAKHKNFLGKCEVCKDWD
ncbi:hypothetical protein ACFLRP_02930, partial [Bacteroidota bacterium]